MDAALLPKQNHKIQYIHFQTCQEFYVDVLPGRSGSVRVGHSSGSEGFGVLSVFTHTVSGKMEAENTLSIFVSSFCSDSHNKNANLSEKDILI